MDDEVEYIIDFLNPTDTIGSYQTNFDFFFTRYGRIWPCYLCLDKFFICDIATSDCGHILCKECFQLKLAENNDHISKYMCG